MRRKSRGQLFRRHPGDHPGVIGAERRIGQDEVDACLIAGEFEFLRSMVLQSTPPETASRSTRACVTASMAFRTSTSTTAFWKDAHKS